MITTEVLIAAFGGRDRLARLEAVYKKARPRRGRWGAGFLTADEVFREEAKDNGFSDEEMALYIDHVSVWSKPR
jgi:hypothetical protein